MRLDLVGRARVHQRAVDARHPKQCQGARWLLACAVGLASAVVPGRSQAVEIDTGGDVVVRLNNTLKFSSVVRASGQNPQILALQNQNDGDSNFRSGFVSNRFDVLSELDVTYHDYGLRVSANGFLDPLYLRRNQNDTPGTFNGYGPQRSFTQDTTRLAGRYGYLDDAFVYGNFSVGDTPFTVRFGRHTVIWGESLFMADNGIAYGQAPIDVLKAATVPNTPAKELFEPVTQLSASVALAPALTLQAYAQFEARQSNIQPVGSYLSASDILLGGGERLLAVAPGTLSRFGLPNGYYFNRGKDQGAANLGNVGLSLHYRPGGGLDLGFYALLFNETEPQVYVRNAGPAAPNPCNGFGFAPNLGNAVQAGPPGACGLGTYNLVYPERIQLYGVSANKTFGDLNVAGEVSARVHNDLQSAVSLSPNQLADNLRRPAYAIGNSLHFQTSQVYIGPSGPFYEGITYFGELGGSQLLGFTKNRQNFDRSRSHTSFGYRGEVDFNYYQVLPGLDVSVPVGFGWNFLGRSATTNVFNNNPADRGGDITVGIRGTYREAWRGSLTYTRYIGALRSSASSQAGQSTEYYNTLNDRDFVAFSLQRTF